MKKYFFTIFILWNFFILYGEQTDDSIITEISNTNIKIGEKIVLLTKLKNFTDSKILWEEINSSDNSVDILEKKDYIKDKYLCIEVIFTFFNEGFYNDFYFTIPISTKEQGIVYLETKKFNINVTNIVSREEIENIKKINDPSKIELKKEKDIENLNFQIKPYIPYIIILLVLILISAILYYILYKIIMKKKDKDDIVNKLSPFEKFQYEISKIKFEPNDTREKVEVNLVLLTESLKELIYGEFNLNAPSETTKELIQSLKQINFNEEIVNKINIIFTDIDLIKFAKASYEYSQLDYYLKKIRELGFDIHELYKQNQQQEENGKK